MGIKNLNSIIKNKIHVNAISLTELCNKKIVIDVSIYMYKFEKDNMLISNMYHMCSSFKKYNVIPLFVFDGKSAVEKQDCLIKRKELKKLAYTKYTE